MECVSRVHPMFATFAELTHTTSFDVGTRVRVLLDGGRAAVVRSATRSIETLGTPAMTSDTNISFWVCVAVTQR